MSINYVSFNQDYSHMAVGTTSGFRIYYTDPFSKCHSTHTGNVSLLEMLFSTSLVALVLSPRRLVITNTKRQSTICELTFPTTILAVRLNRKRLVVVLEDQIYLYDISNMKLVHTIDTAPNPAGICALSPSSDRCYLAYPLPQRAAPSFAAHTPAHVPPSGAQHHQALAPASGHVMIFDALALTAVNVIEAHRAPLSCLAMSADGARLATASDKGTVIRVFSIPDARKLAQFRRGSMPARIYSMAFNAMASLLCVSSGSETVHVFKLAPDGGAAAAGDSDTARSPSPTQRRPRSQSRSLSSTSEKTQYQQQPSYADDDALGRSMGPGSSSAASSSDAAAAERAHDGTFAGMLRRTSQSVSKSLAARVGGYLPTSVSEMLEPQRDFAWFKLPRPGAGAGAGPMRSVVALSSNSPQVMVVTSEGVLLVYNIDLERGGEGTLVRQYAVLDEDEGGRTGRVDD